MLTNPRYGYGPYSDGIFTHSNFGIVTKMGIWLMPKTEVYTYAMSFQNDEDYATIMDTVQPLILRRVFTGAVQMGDATHEVLVGHKNDRAKLWDGKGAIPRNVLYKWMEKNSPFGRCKWVMYGKRERVFKAQPTLYCIFVLIQAQVRNMGPRSPLKAP